MHNQTSRFPVMPQQQQAPPRMINPQPNIPNQMPRLREPQKFNPSKIFKMPFFFSLLIVLFLFLKDPMNTLSYCQTPASATTTTTTIDLSQGYSSQQINGTNQNNYASLQPQYPIQSAMNMPRQRAPMINSKLNTSSFSLFISFFFLR